MRRVIPRFSSLAVSLGITGLFAIGYPADVRAQTIFCPAIFSGHRVHRVHLLFCKRVVHRWQDGAFSGAALASQSLSELSQTTTETTTKEVGKSIVERREQERERMQTPRAPSARSFSRRSVPAEPARRSARKAASSRLQALFADRTCRPIWDLDSSLWRLSEEGRCWT